MRAFPAAKNATFVAFLALVVATGCEDPAEPIIEPPPPTVTISPLAPSINVGEVITFQAAVTNAAAGVTWSSSNSAVVSINENSGQATGVAAGTATIRARLVADETINSVTTVTVRPTSVPGGTITVLGTGAVSERYTAEIATANGYAYTTTWGFRSTYGNVVKIWNVAGTTPVLIDSLTIADAGTTSDVQISPDGSLLVVSTEGRNTGSIVIYSMATPAKPTFVSRVQTEQTRRGVHTVKLSSIGGRLYAFMQIDPPAALMIMDITNPTAAEQVFYQPMGAPYIHDVFVRDGLLFAALWDDGMTIFDVGGGGRGGSPSNPVQISNVRTATGDIHNIWWVHDPVTGAKKYAILGEEGPSNGLSNASGDIHVIDVSNLAAPVEVAVYSVPGAGAHNFFVDEQSGILYAAYYNGGVRALDVRGDLGTCTAAQRVATGTYAGKCDLRLMGRELAAALTSGSFYIWGVAMDGTRLYASDMKTGIIAMDISTLKR